MANYLVTGAAGFIGSKVASRLLSQSHKVYVIDNLSTGSIENIPKGAVFEEGSVYDDTVEKFASIPFSAIIHIAGQSSGEISFYDPVYDIRTNTESTLKLVNFALKNKCARFIYTSTMSVYGAVADEPIEETYPTFPISFYGVGKLAGEHYLRIYSNRGIEPTILRLFNVYGPGQNMKNLRQGMVSIYLAYVMKNVPILVRGSGERFRDFIYIEDVVDAYEHCLKMQSTINKTYNVGSGEKTTINTLIAQIKKVINDTSYPVEFISGTPGDQFGIYANIDNFRRDTGWSPKTPPAQGLKLMVEWCRKTNY